MAGSVCLKCQSICSDTNKQRHGGGVDPTHPGICDFELSENVLGHVVLCHRIHHKVLVPGRALRWPVLMALLLQKRTARHIQEKNPNKQITQTSKTERIVAPKPNRALWKVAVFLLMPSERTAGHKPTGAPGTRPVQLWPWGERGLFS